MLKYFSVTNYRGFKDKIELDCSKTRDYAFNKSFIKNGLVNKGLIYGINGSGKSNLGLALYDITSHLTDKNRKNRGNVCNLSSIERYNDFVYVFLIDGQELTYKYRKDANSLLVKEELFVDGELNISYDFLEMKHIINDEKLKDFQINLKDNKLSILKHIYRGFPTDSTLALTKVIDFAEGMLWFRSLKSNEYVGFQSGTENLNDIIIDNDKLKNFEEFLKECGLEYNLYIVDSNGHKKIWAKFEKGDIPFEDIASTGTNTLWLFYCWYIKFSGVTLLYLDEFDAFYHYALSEKILKLVTTDTSFQAFVTTHNTHLMNNELIRPDCCFVIGDNLIKSLPECTDKEIREAHNLEKIYINGGFC